jgi:hypothetical protein
MVAKDDAWPAGVRAIIKAGPQLPHQLDGIEIAEPRLLYAVFRRCFVGVDR